ncbi:MAG: PAS domain S-box protein, partial [Bacteroidota bacterium]
MPTPHNITPLSLHESRFRALIENNIDVVALLDAAGTVTYTSPSVENVIGYTPEEFENRSAFELIHPDNLEEAMRRFGLLVASRGMVERMELRYQHKDGSWRWLEVVGKNMLDEEGINAVVVNYRDISERIVVQDALEKSVSLLSSTLESSTDGILVVNPEGKITIYNKKFAEMWRIPEPILSSHNDEQALAFVLSQLKYPDEFLTKVKMLYSNLLEASFDVLEFLDGRIFERYSHPQLLDGKPIGRVWSFRDVTRRKRMKKIQNTIYKISEAANTVTNIDELYRSIHTIIAELMPAKNLFIAQYDESTSTLSFPYFIDEFDQTPAPRVMGRGMTEYVIRTGKPLLIYPNEFQELIRSGEVEEIGADSFDWLGVPLKVREKIVGAIVVQSYTKNIGYNEEDKMILNFVSEQIAMAIERRRTEESLRKSEANVISIIENTSDMIWSIDRQYRIVAMNTTYRNVQKKLFDIDLEIGMHKLETLPDKFRAQWKELYDRALRGERFMLEHHYDFPTMSMDVDFSFNPIFSDDGTVRGVSIFARDISERNRNEQALKQSEVRFNLVMEATKDIIYDWDMMNDFILWNPTLTEVLGYTIEEFGSSLLNWEEKIHPDDCKFVVEKLEKSIALHELFLCEYRFRKKDGEYATVLDKGKVMYDGNNKPIRMVGAMVDLTSLKQTEIKLRESEERYRLLFERNLAGVYRTSLEGAILDANIAAAKILGYKSVVDILEGTAQNLYINPVERIEFIDRLQRFGSLTNMETQLRRKDGSTVWVLENANLIRETAITPAMIEGTLIDITNIKRAEESLIKDAEQRKHLLEISQKILSLHSLDEVIRTVFSALKEVVFFETCGVMFVDDEQKLLRPYLFIGAEWISKDFHRWSMPMHKGIAGEVAATGKPVLINNSHLDARSFYPPEANVNCEHLICLPLTTKGKTIGVILISRKSDPKFTQDEYELIQLYFNSASLIIENTRLFEQMKISEEKYRTLFEESKDVILFSTLDGKILDINSAGIELFGYDAKEEMLKLHIGKNLLVDENQRKDFITKVQKNGFVKDYEKMMKRKDGSIITLLATATPEYNESGAIIGFREILRDVTEKKKLEEQLRHAQKMESIGTLAGGIAHDFNNTLGIMLANLTVVRKQLELPHDVLDVEKIAHHISSVDKAIQRGAGLVKQLLTFARKSEPLFESVNVNESIQEIISLIHDTFSKTITVQADLQEQLPSIVADHNQVHGVLLN